MYDFGKLFLHSSYSDLSFISGNVALAYTTLQFIIRSPFSPKKPHTVCFAYCRTLCRYAFPLKIVGARRSRAPASSACMTEPEVGHVNSSFSPVLLSRKLDVIKPEASTQVSCILPTESRSHSFPEPRIAAVVFFFFFARACSFDIFSAAPVL